MVAAAPNGDSAMSSSLDEPTSPVSTSPPGDAHMIVDQEEVKQQTQMGWIRVIANEGAEVCIWDKEGRFLIPLGKLDRDALLSYFEKKPASGAGEISGFSDYGIYLRECDLKKKSELEKSGTIKSGQKIGWIRDTSWKSNGNIEHHVMEVEIQFLRIVSEDGVDVYPKNSHTNRKKKWGPILRLSKDNIRLCMKKVWFLENKRGETLQSGVWEYKILLHHDDMIRIEQHANADSRTTIPKFGWIRHRVPNKTDSGLAGDVRLETVSHENGRTDKDNENMERKVPKVASDKFGLATLRQLKLGAYPSELRVVKRRATKKVRPQKRQRLESMDGDW